MNGGTTRKTFTEAEAEEIRGLLDGLPFARRAEQRMSVARLRRMGLPLAAGAEPTLSHFEDLVSSGELVIEKDPGHAKLEIPPHPSGNIFRVAVGVTGDSVGETWSAFDQRYQWFGKPPRSVTSGAHLFVLAVDRWKSAVVGLYEAVSAGADKLPNSPNPERWPWALGVRPLAAIPPPLAERVEGQQGPQSGLPIRVTDERAQQELYRVVADSPPPPGPQTLEQRVQEVQWQDVVVDVIDAVRSLAPKARESDVLQRSIELGGWTDEELGARAWYTGSGVDSHIENILKQALKLETVSKGALQRVHGFYSLREGVSVSGFGVPYRTAADDRATEKELPEHLVDLSELDRATKRHMLLQDRLADTLRELDIEARSPSGWQPKFDLAFEHAGEYCVVEVKGGDPVSAQQVRLGVGQLLEYGYLLRDSVAHEVQLALLMESQPPEPWDALVRTLGIQILQANELNKSLSELLRALETP